MFDTKIYKSIKASAAEAVSWFWLKPGALWRHNETSISNIHKLLKFNRIHGECSNTIFIASLDKLFKSSDSSNEVNSIIRSEVMDFENG